MTLRKVCILTLCNQVGILTLRRTILECYRFLLCTEHIYGIYDCCFRFIQTYDRHCNCYSFDNIGLVKQQDKLGKQMFQLFHKWLLS